MDQLNQLNPTDAGFRSVLGQRDFRLVWFGQVASQTADKFVMFSLIILTFAVTNASTQVAITLLSYTLPALVIPPFAGVFADRHDRKRIMVVANVARAALVALIPLSALLPQLRHDHVHVLVITFAFSAMGQMFSPAEAAAIPTILPRRALLTANSIVMMTMVLALVLGGALAPVATAVNPYGSYWIAAALFAVAAGLVASARIAPQPPRTDTSTASATAALLGEIREALSFLRASRVLMISFAQLTLAVLVLFMMFTLAPAYVQSVLGISSQQSYVILVPATVGTIVAAILLGTVGRHVQRERLVAIALVATGVTLCALAGVPFVLRHIVFLRGTTYGFGVIVSLLMGLEFGAMMIPALTFLMERTTDEVRGRIFSLFFLAYNGATALPILITGFLADAIGPASVIAALGVLLGLAGGVAFRLGEPTPVTALSAGAPRSR